MTFPNSPLTLKMLLLRIIFNAAFKHFIAKKSAVNSIFSILKGAEFDRLHHLIYNIQLFITFMCH